MHDVSGQDNHHKDNIDYKTKSLSKEDNAFHFCSDQKNVVYHNLLKSGETVNTPLTTNE